MEPSHTRTERTEDRSRGRISVETLIVASVASAAASFLASRVWGAGTLVSAALTPVVVALVSESLRRPVQTVAETAKKVPAAVYTLPGHERTAAAPQDTTQPQDDADQQTPAPAPPSEEQSPPDRQPQPSDSPQPSGEAAQAQGGGRATTPGPTVWRHRWLWAIVTGLVAFAIVVVLFTVPELVAGRSITGNSQPTTFFGSSGKATRKASPTTTTTTTTPATTVTKTASTTTTTTSTTSTTTAPASTSSSSSSASATSTASAAPPAVSSTSTSSTQGP